MKKAGPLPYFIKENDPAKFFEEPAVKVTGFWA